jgi:hypothetical protein
MRATKRILTIAVVGFLQSGMSCHSSDTISDSTTGIALRHQETTNWCWAATTEMIAEHLGQSIEQCELANAELQRSDCCSGDCPRNPMCSRPGWPKFAEIGVAFEESENPLTWDQIKNEIGTHSRPLAYAYGPKTGGVGHILVIYGFSEMGETDQDRLLHLKDPWAPCAGDDRSITYSEYNNSGIYDHWVTFLNIVSGN